MFLHLCSKPDCQ